MEKFEFRRNLISSNTINIHLVKTMGLSGISDDTKDFTDSTKISLVNPTTDAEYIRFNYDGSNFDLIPNFKGVNQTYSNSLRDALFNSVEIKNRAENVTNSYFIFELYDSNDINNQTLLSSNKMDIYTRSGYTYNMFDSNNNNLLVKIPYIYPNKYFLEFSNIYIPNNYIETLKNVVYMKIRFFNAKLGGVTDFYTGNGTLEPIETDFYIKLNFNKNNYTYGFDNKTITNIYENKNVNLTKINNDNNAQNPILNDSKKDNIIIGYGESGN
jgi:hypothetical protein